MIHELIGYAIIPTMCAVVSQSRGQLAATAACPAMLSGSVPLLCLWAMLPSNRTRTMSCVCARFTFPSV